jgi:hypothetical protein
MQNPTTGLKVAVLLILVLFFYLCAVSFWPIPQTGNEHAKTIVPFLLGIIATLIGFYWGNSHKDAPTTITPVDEAAITAAKEKAKEVIEPAK